jgi:c-di-AMP phosphodiesterase-like protein
MKKIKILLVALLFTAMVHAQTTSTPEQIAIQQTIENLFAALTKGDTTAMKKMTTNTVRFYEYGEVWPMDTLISKVMKNKSTADFKRTNKFEFVNTTIHKNTAWATYYLQSNFTRNGKEELVRWMETVVLIKDKKQWKIDVLHSTRLTKK